MLRHCRREYGFTAVREVHRALKVSVVVPALNEAEQIGACLTSIVSQPGDNEVIVVDGGSTDGTPEIARRHAAVVIDAPRGRAVQMNAGAAIADGDILLFLHADSMLHRDAFTAMREALSDPTVAGGTFTLRFDADRFILRIYAAATRFRHRLFHYGDQGIFVRREAFSTLGGYADYPLMEDVDLLRRIERIGRRVLVPCPVTTSARRFIGNGPIRQQGINAILVMLFHAGVDPHELAVWYDRGRRRQHAATQEVS